MMKICQSCRFNKCLAIGMLAKCVKLKSNETEKNKDNENSISDDCIIIENTEDKRIRGTSDSLAISIRDIDQHLDSTNSDCSNPEQQDSSDSIIALPDETISNQDRMIEMVIDMDEEEQELLINNMLIEESDDELDSNDSMCSPNSVNDIHSVESTGDSSKESTTSGEQECCRVCGGLPSGNHFNSRSCEACRHFFRHTISRNLENEFQCKHDNSCKINTETRNDCQKCRFEKCLRVGMRRECIKSYSKKVQDKAKCIDSHGLNAVKNKVEKKVSKPKQLCWICEDKALGFNYNAITCNGCRNFYKRCITTNPVTKCKYESKCVIDLLTRNKCRYCRYKKCKAVGMKDVTKELT